MAQESSRLILRLRRAVRSRFCLVWCLCMLRVDVAVISCRMFLRRCELVKRTLRFIEERPAPFKFGQAFLSSGAERNSAPVMCRRECYRLIHPAMYSVVNRAGLCILID